MNEFLKLNLTHDFRIHYRVSAIAESQARLSSESIVFDPEKVTKLRLHMCFYLAKPFTDP